MLLDIFGGREVWIICVGRIIRVYGCSRHEDCYCGDEEIGIRVLWRNRFFVQLVRGPSAVYVKEIS